MPQTTVVFPILTIAEPSDVPIESTLIITGRNELSSLPSGRMSLFKKSL